MTAKEKKQARKNKKNARIARCRFLKNLLIWFIGVLFLPSIIAVAVFLVPISTYMNLTGQDTSESVNAELTNKSLFGALTSIGDYTISDLPFIISLVESIEDTEISEGSTLGDLVEIDYAKLKTLKFGSSTFSEDLGSCFKVVATINSVGASGFLGDLNVESFNTFTAVENADRPSLDGNGYIEKDENEIMLANPKLYYYKASDLGGNAPYAVVNGEKYERAFTDDGKLLVPENVTLYYVPLFEAPILDALDLIDEILGRLEVTELLAVAGVEFSEEGEEGIIEKLLGGKTVAELGTLGLDGIYIYDVLGGNTTDLIYTVLSQATEKEVEEITFEHLMGDLAVDNILLSTFIGEAEGEIDVLEILSQIVEVEEGEAPTKDTLNVGHLSNINPSKLSIGKILPYKEYKDGVLTKDNSELYEILCKAVIVDSGEQKPTPETLNIGHLSNLNLDSVPLTQFVDDEDMLKILCDAVVVNAGETPPTTETLNIGHLKNLEMEKVALSKVLPYKEYEDGVLTKDNSKLYKIILSAIVENGVSKLPVQNADESDEDYELNVQGIAESLTVDDFSKVKPDLMKISVIMASPNSTFVEILEYTTGKDYSKITVGELESLNPDSIALSVFIDMPADVDDPETTIDETQINKTLYDILLQSLVIKDEEGKVITNPKYEDIKLNHLNNFKVDNILLNTVMPRTEDNAKLYDILKDITGKDYDAVSLSDLKKFKTDDILLNTVVPYDEDKNGKLYAVLQDVTGYGYTGVKISMLQSFDPLKIKLNTVLKEGDNNILNALLDKGGTLGTMDENVSTLTLYEVYKDTCFTKDKEYTNDLSKKYKLKEVDGKHVYTLDDDGEYYLNVNAGVWLIMCFDGNAKDTDGGVSTEFTESTLTLGDMQTSGNKLNERIQNATIRELISAGIMPNVGFNNEKIYHMTFAEFIKFASFNL